MRAKALTAVMIGVVFITMGSLSAYAKQDISSKGETEGEVIQVAIPDQNGNLKFYTGEDAKVLYNQAQNQTVEEIPKEEANKMDDNIFHPDGMFTYKYRFVTKSSGTKYGASNRITQYLKNETNTKQSMSVEASTSVSWGIDVSLSGEFKDAFEASVGGNWKKTSSFRETLNVDVPAKSTVWLEFKPLLNYVNGEAQKYYVTRGPVKTTIIESRKSVYSTSPRHISINIGKKSIMGPDGMYVWKQR